MMQSIALWLVRNLLLLFIVAALMTACGRESTPSESWSGRAPAEDDPMFSIPQPVYPQPVTGECVTAMFDLAGTPRVCSPTMGALEVAQ